MMTKVLSGLLAVAAALPVTAHQIECRHEVGLAAPSGTGPVLGPDGLPVFTAAPRAVLTLDAYPALVALDLEIRNLAMEPSIVTRFAQTLPGDASRVASFGVPLSGSIAVGGALRRVHTVPVDSYEQCLALFGPAPVGSPVCAHTRDLVLTATTDSDIASCRARVVCKRPVEPPPPPPPPQCTAPVWTGSQRVPVVGATFLWSVALGCDGSTYATGSSGSPLAPDPKPPPGVVFRWDAAGSLAGEVRLDVVPQAVRLDAAGNIHVAGTDGGSGFVRKYAPDGTLLWEHLTDSLTSVGDLGLDAAGNVYLGMEVAKAAQPLVAKLDGGGTLLWTRAGPSGGRMGSIAVTPDGHLFATGSTFAAVPGAVNAGQEDAYLIHFDADGGLVWARQLGTAGNDSGGGVALGMDGRVALAGATGGSLDGGAVPGRNDAFVAVFDAAGTLQWVRQLRASPIFAGAAGSSGAGSAAFDATGAVWIGGSTDTGVLPGATFSGLGNNAFVARYDAAGTYLWGRQWGGPRADDVTALVVDRAGFGIATVNTFLSLATHDASVVRLSPDGT